MLRFIALLVAVLLIALDQLSKQSVLENLHHAGASIRLPGPVDLTLVFNRSDTFNLVPISGETTRWGFVAASLFVGLLLSWALIRRPWSDFTSFGFALIIAGATGNALDRIRLGAVVDFIDASKEGFVWVFNGADLFLYLGLTLVLLGALLRRPTI